MNKSVAEQIASLSAAAANGMDIPVCGRTLKLRPLPLPVAKKILDRVKQRMKNEPAPAEPAQSPDLAAEMLDLLVEIFQRDNENVTRETFAEHLTDVDLRIIWLAFKEMNAGVVSSLLSMFAPLAEHAKERVMASVIQAMFPERAGDAQ